MSANPAFGRRSVLAMAAAVVAVSVPLGMLLAPGTASGRTNAVARTAAAASPVIVASASSGATPTTSGSPTGTSSPAAPPSSLAPSPPPADVTTGQTLYEERCSTCHGPDAAGTSQGPPIAGLGPAYYDFMMSTGRMPLAQPGSQDQRRPPVLSPDQIRAITDYLSTLATGGIPIPEVDPAQGTLPDGQLAFQANCAPCHGTTGRGGAVGEVDAPPVVHASAVEVAPYR